MAGADSPVGALVDLPVSANDSEWKQAAKAALLAHRTRMLADYAAGVPVQCLIGQWCAAIDAVVVSA